MARGKFISIEGIEGAGKSTALHYIKAYLINADIPAVWTREPGGSAAAEELRKLVLHPRQDEEIFAETELLLMFAGRMQHMKNTILPALNAGKWVVSDRFIDASYAYQGGGRGINMQYIKMLDEWIVNSHYPDLTLLLDVTPEIGFARAEKRGTEKDRIEQEKMDFFVRIREAYLTRAKQDTQRIKIIDASLPIFAVEEQIREILDALMANKINVNET